MKIYCQLYCMPFCLAVAELQNWQNYGKVGDVGFDMV